MTDHPARAAAWFLATAVVAYGVLLAIALGLAMANGEGLSCREAECGSVSSWLNDAYPFPMIAATALSLIAGGLVARCRTRT